MATSNISKDKIIKYKDYTKTDSYTANELSSIADLDTDGIAGYTPIAAIKIEPLAGTGFRMIPYIYNWQYGTHLVAHNISGSSLSSATYVYRVYFVRNDFIG